MPRPGPRPYECVRRAWHSDRHQPMRGSLIQEIFRVVNEVHSPSTRRNKEWQEKLPCVVLKAEEIMYSKANSEAEYMDLKTLWDRANDAIDTIIRRDETTESGDLLKPCIEAALNLGCIPRRASRSQRHSNHVCYLSSSTRDVPATPLEFPDNTRTRQGSSISLLPLQPSRSSTQQSSASQFTPWYSASVAPSAMNSYLPEVESTMPDASHEKKHILPIPNYDFSFPAKNSPYFCQDASLPIAMESCIRPSLGRVYPLYYGNNQPETGSYLSPQKPQEPVHGLAAAVTMSHFPPTGTGEIGFLQNYFVRNENVDVPNGTSNLKKMPKNPSIPSCDLSLGLGLPSAPFLVVENAWTHGIEDVASSSSCDGSKSCGLSSTRERAIDLESSLSSPKDKFYDLFPKYSTDEHMESCSSKWSSEGEGTSHLKASDKKRKVRTSAPSNDGYSHWKQNVLTYHLACETGTANS